MLIISAGPDVVNASHNWWGSNDVTSAYGRVYDQRRDPGVLLIDLDPILTDPAFDCSDVANCSGRGECVSPNTCRCDAGASPSITVVKASVKLLYCS